MSEALLTAIVPTSLATDRPPLSTTRVGLAQSTLAVTTAAPVNDDVVNVSLTQMTERDRCRTPPRLTNTHQCPGAPWRGTYASSRPASLSDSSDDEEETEEKEEAKRETTRRRFQSILRANRRRILNRVDRSPKRYPWAADIATKSTTMEDSSNDEEDIMLVEDVDPMGRMSVQSPPFRPIAARLWTADAPHPSLIRSIGDFLVPPTPVSTPSATPIFAPSRSSSLSSMLSQASIPPLHLGSATSSPISTPDE